MTTYLDLNDDARITKKVAADSDPIANRVAATGNDGYLAPTILKTVRIVPHRPSDSDWTSVPPDGTLALDRVRAALYIRVFGVWMRIPLAMPYSAMLDFRFAENAVYVGGVV